MQPDIFGDLRRTNEVLAKLEELTSQDCLDEHQIGLARILRFKQNPGLLHTALEYSTRIERASDILIAEVLNVLVAQDLPISTRALAADVLGHLICCRPTDIVSDFDLDMVIESMGHVLYRSESPVLKKTLFKAIGLARSKKLQIDGKSLLHMPRSKLN